MFFNKFKKIDNNKWGEAYKASPNVYANKDGDRFGAIALTENTLTILPKDPKAVYTVGGEKIDDWKLVLVSTTKDTVLGNIDYYVVLDKMKNYVVESNDESLLIPCFTVGQMENLLKE